MVSRKEVKKMKRSTVVMMVAIGVIFCLTSVAGQSSAGKGIIKMVGKITYIDPLHKTVVVEVPIGKTAAEEQLFTVAGPLASGAKLTKGSRTVELKDFKVGEQVTVKWKEIETGHLILSLQDYSKK
jgi:hypothetical protein